MFLRTLGKLELVGTDLQRPSLLLLVCYLTLEGPKSRRALAELFWPGAKDPRDSLSTALRRVRKASPDLVVAEGAEVRSVIRSDAQELLGLLDRDRLDEAEELYRGAFLEGLDVSLGEELEEWVFQAREFIAGRTRQALVHRAEAAASEGDMALAARLAERAYALPGARELDPEELVRLLALARDCDSPMRARLEDEAASLGLALPSRQRKRQRPPGGVRVAAPAPELPPGATSFVGRRRELAEVSDLLDDPACRLLTVHGPGGIGKTRLAMQVALAPSTADRFGGGVFHVGLESLADAADVPARVAEELGLDLRGQQDPLALVGASIGARDVLVVLDNFERVVDAAGDLVYLLRACPDLMLLVTSRERLNVTEEWVLALDGLSVDPGFAGESGDAESEAAKLFIDRARRVRRDFAPGHDDMQQVAELCRTLGGSPLGIELAAAWVNTLPLPDIASQIERSLGFLESPMRNASQRHKSIRAAFEHSWRMLGNFEQEVMRRLAVVRGGFRREAAAVLTGASIPTLASLVDTSLLRLSQEGRYDRHPLLFAYTVEKLAEHPDEERRAKDAHASYYLRQAQHWQASYGRPHHAEMLQFFEEELENIRGAWNWALSQDNHADLLRCAPAVSDAFDNRTLDGARHFAHTVDVLERQEATPARREALGAASTEQAWHLERLTRYQESNDLSRRGLESLPSSGAWESRLRATFTLYRAASRTSDFGGAAKWLSDGLRLAEQARLPRYTSMFLAAQAYLEMRAPTKELGDAVAYFASVEDQLRALGNLDVLSMHLSGFGWYLLEHLEPARARARFLQCIELCEVLGVLWIVPYSLCGLGAVALAESDHEGAASYLDQALAAATDRDDKFLHVHALAIRSRLSAARGHVEDAQGAARRALDLARAIRNVPRMLFCSIPVAEILARRGKPEEAAEVLQLALAHPEFEERLIAERILESLSPRAAPAGHGHVDDASTANIAELHETLANHVR